MLRKFLFTLTIFILVISSIPIFSKWVDTTRVTSSSHTIHTEDVSPVSIAFISDLYLTDENIPYLDKIVKQLNSNNPDIVVIGGNLLEDPENFKNYTEVSTILASIRAPYGKFAYYKNDNLTDEQVEYIDFIYNDGDFQKINGSRKLYVGKENPELNIIPTYSQADLNNVDSGLLNISLIQHPNLIDDLELDGVDIVLSSGALGGIINLPFGILEEEKFASNYNPGNTKKGDTDLIISNGLGLPSEYSMRIFNNPKINFINISK